MQPSYTPTTAVPPPPPPASSGRYVRPRHLQFAGFLAAMAWYVCARTLAASAAHGIGLRFNLGDLQPLLEALFQVFLIIFGIGLLANIERRRAPLRVTLGLPRRRTAQREWSEGVVIGWAVAVAAVLPLALTRTLDMRLWNAPRAWELAGVNLVTLALLTLANSIGIFGYAFSRLIETTGPTRATILLMLVSGIVSGFNVDAGGAPGLRVLVALLAVALLCLCWLRTHGLWLLWGLQFALAAALGIVFGLPLAGSTTYSAAIETRTAGPLWLTGGQYGPGAGVWTVLVLLVAIPVLIRLTSDYAWEYTHPPIIPGGYEVDVPPPAAHASMEAVTAPPPPPLVQILPAAPPPPPISRSE